MLRKPILQIQDSATKEHLEHIYEEAQGKVITLSAVPTATDPLLSDNEWGVYSNVLYQRVANKILVYTPSSTITVS